MPALIRPARVEDRDFVLSLVPRFVERLPPTRARQSTVLGIADWLQRGFDDPPAGASLLVAEEDGALTGFVYLNAVDDFFTGTKQGHVSEIAVARDHRGTGAALMAASEAWARQRGYVRLTLNVFEDNEGAQRFYTRIGFVPETRQLVKLL